MLNKCGLIINRTIILLHEKLNLVMPEWNEYLDKIVKLDNIHSVSDKEKAISC